MQKFAFIVCAWLGVGIIAQVATFLKLYNPPLSLILVLLVVVFFIYFRKSHFKQFFWLEKILLAALAFVLLSHAVGIFTPEVGFDAVWYHLPVLRAIVQNHGLVYLPDLYQSVNPLFSDLIIGLGYLAYGEIGAKIVAYMFGASLVIGTYELSKQVLEYKWALVAALIVSLFQVVAWQSSSFYVDVAKAFWEVSMLWFALRWLSTQNKAHLFLAGLAMGASLGTKLFSLLLLPFWAVLLLWMKKTGKQQQSWLASAVALLIPLPYYIFSYLKTGRFLFSINTHLDKLSEIGGGASVLEHVRQRTIELPTVLRELLWGRDYTTVLLLVFLPLVLVSLKQLWDNENTRVLLVWTIIQIGLWWYLPPLSTRYALSGFITWTILSIWSTQTFVKKNKKAQLAIGIAIALAVSINVLPRLYVNYRSAKYLLGYQSKTEYIQQFYDGTIDQHLERWHAL
jgi:4-amino-4-deoxy-L-arabinose transferase-like glycosyltransferase